MLLTVPIFFPLAQTLGFDPIWFALIMLLSLEISFTTPHLRVAIVRDEGGVSPRNDDARDIHFCFPVHFCSLFLVVLLIAFPQIALWLPAL
jgi:TRAP-type mannitol/chloroaromatic compound transport system permease large subunit